MDIICSSRDIFLAQASFGFGSVWKLCRGWKSKPFLKSISCAWQIRFDFRNENNIADLVEMGYFAVGDVIDNITGEQLKTHPSIIMFISFCVFLHVGAKRENQMLCATRCSQTSTISRIFVWKFILKIDGDITIQIFNFVCYLVPWNLEWGIRISVNIKTRLKTTFPENLSTIDTVVAMTV